MDVSDSKWVGVRQNRLGIENFVAAVGQFLTDAFQIADPV